MEQFVIWSNKKEGWLRPRGPVEKSFTNYLELAGEYSFEEASKICEEVNKSIDFVHFYPNEQTPIPDMLMLPIKK